MVTGTDTGNDPGTVHVIIDEFEAIQCGLSVQSDDDPRSICGAPFSVVPATQVNPNLQN